MGDLSLLKRTKALILLRAFFVTLLIGTFFVFDIGSYRFPYLYGIQYLIITLYILSVLYAILLGRVRNLVAFAYTQLCIDVVSVITLIILTGGIESWFSSVMIMVVIASAITIGKKAGFIIATLSSILYGSVIDLQFYRFIPVSYDLLIKEKDFLYNIFSHISALYLTAYLTGHMSSRLEKTSRSLQEKDSDLRDLAFFNKELIESLPSGLLTTDLSGNIVIFNRAAEHILHTTRAAAVHKQISDLLPFITLPLSSQRAEGTIVHNGDSRIIGLTLSGLMDSTGSENGFICIFQDVTDIKNLETELKQKETLAAIGELSANMAHEIRNPLASLKGSIELLREGSLTPDYGEKLMNIALSEMDRLNKIITDFLIYSRPRHPEFCSFDLHAMLDETIELLRSATASTDTLLIKRAFHGQHKIVGDPQKLRQVFLNIGMNAIDAMPDGGELVIETRDSREMVTVTMQDTGIGIPREHLQDIFYPFFTTKEKGTGLGLSIAYRIIDEHKGKIMVRSKPGAGTTFEVSLPLLQYYASTEKQKVGVGQA